MEDVNNIASMTAEIERLRKENTRLKETHGKAFHYIRDKIDQLLVVMGTVPLRQEELDDKTLIDLDPIGIISDSFIQILSNLRKTNNDLKLAKDEIEAIFDSSGAALLVLDPQKRILACNNKTRQLFDLEEIPEGATCHECVCGGKTPVESCIFEKVIKSGRGENATEWFCGRRWFDVVGTPIKDDNDEITHIVLAYNEVTERKESEAKLRNALDEASEARTRIDGILRSVADGLIVTDMDERIVLLNQKAEEILGICLRDSVGIPLSRAVKNKSLLQYIRTYLSSEETATAIDFILPDPSSSSPRIFQARGSLLCENGEKRQGMVTTFHEVTRERELARLKSEFVSTAAHELRTPLASILGYSELLLGDGDFSHKDQNDFLGIIQEKAEYLSEIVNDLLDISRIESGQKLDLRREDCSLNKILEGFEENFRKVLTGYRFILDLPASPIDVYIDRRAICQVFENLLGNAVKYSPDGGNITLAARTRKNLCHISITDTGIGMTKDQVKHAFDTFYRADASNTAIRGTGLGLTIVKHILEAHGSDIRLESVPGEGTTVHFSLPLAEQPLSGKRSS